MTIENEEFMQECFPKHLRSNQLWLVPTIQLELVKVLMLCELCIDTQWKVQAFHINIYTWQYQFNKKLLYWKKPFKTFFLNSKQEKVFFASQGTARTKLKKRVKKSSKEELNMWSDEVFTK